MTGHMNTKSLFNSYLNVGTSVDWILMNLTALATRDLARQNQHRKEIALLSESKDRERHLAECRRTAEERKNYFESMERHMFASKTSVKASSSLHLILHNDF